MVDIENMFGQTASAPIREYENEVDNDKDIDIEASYNFVKITTHQDKEINDDYVEAETKNNECDAMFSNENRSGQSVSAP